jgi:2-keto-3-deoxy-L-arabinonate dehydratase
MTSTLAIADIAGIWPILYAFFDQSNRIDRAAMQTQVEACVAEEAPGLAVMGLATEIGKLSTAERHEILEIVAEALAGRRPLAVTIGGASVEAQVEFGRAAQRAGASWVILQPPPERGLPELDYLRFFGAVADKLSLPIAIQNAPQYTGVGLSNAGLRELNRQHPNISLLKAESSAADVRRLVEESAGVFRIFNGRGGMELPDNLRAGCVGLIPAPECVDVQLQIFKLMQAGNEAEAERLYRSILPLIVFLMQSLDTFLCYGKRLTAQRLGLGPVYDRQPAMTPTAFGLDSLTRYAAGLGRFKR